MKLLTNMNIRGQLFLLLIVLIVPVLLLNGYANAKAQDILKKQVTGAYVELIKQNHDLIGRDIDTVYKITTTIIQNALTQRMSYRPEESTYERVRKYSEMNKLLESYSLGVDEGEAVLYSLFIQDVHDAHSFAPDYGHVDRGVFFFPEEETPDWYKEAEQLRGKGMLRIMDSFGTEKRKTLAYIRAVNDVHRGQSAVGVLVVTHLERKINETLQDVSLPEGNILFLSLDHILYAGSAASIGTRHDFPQPISQSHTGHEPVTLIASDYIYVMHNDMIQQHKLVYQIPVESLIRQQSELKRAIRMISVVYVVLCFLLMLYFFRSLVRPLLRMAVFLKSYEPGQVMQLSEEAKRKDEVGILISSTYQMTKRLKALIHDKYEMEIKQKEAQLQLLYEQINPHLLYNTLESIYWKSSLHGDNESAEMIKELSKLMKIGLSKGRDLITLEEELEHVQAYIGLQQKRFDYDFQMRWKIDSEALPCFIPKITLQPLVENAILHGVRNMGEDGEIFISCQNNLERDQIIISIEDNGFKPIDLTSIRALLQAKDGNPDIGYGIGNVHRRIQMHFGDTFGLDYAHREGGGTCAVLTIPRRREPHV